MLFRVVPYSLSKIVISEELESREGDIKYSKEEIRLYPKDEEHPLTLTKRFHLSNDNTQFKIESFLYACVNLMNYVSIVKHVRT